ncbi:MAG: PAS domain S-box protein [Candidatus Hermodarchaeia archaeon]|jgi:PAS domain S-box-containing protein
MVHELTHEQLQQRVKELEKQVAEGQWVEQALDAQRQELISIFDSIDEAIYVCDPESHEVLYVNAATKALFGPHIVGKKCYRVFQGLNEPCDFCTNPMILGKNLGRSYVWEFQNKLNGRWYRCIDKAIGWPDGKMVRYEIAIDIHDLKLAEEALRDGENRYRRIAEAVTDYIYTVRIEDGRPVETTHGPACVAITGYTAEEFKNNPYLWIEMVHEEDRKAVEEQATQTLSGVKVEPLEHRIIRKDGAIRWVKNTPVPNYDGRGRVLSYDGLIRDITDHKMAEEALRESEANYRLLFSAESDAIVVVDANTKEIVDANEAACALYGYDREEFLGLSAIELSAEPEKTAAHIEAVASGKPAEVFPGPEQRLHKRKDGKTFPAEISSGIYALKERKMVCAIIRDITERKRMEEALEKSLHELELRVKGRTDELVKATQALKREIEQRKRAQEGLRETETRLHQEEKRMEILKFANDLALKLMHELRNPLVTIGGFSRRITTGDHSEEKLKEYARVIFEGSVRLDNVLNEVLAHLRKAAEQT